MTSEERVPGQVRRNGADCAGSDVPANVREVKQRLAEQRLSPAVERAARAVFERPHDFAFLPLAGFADQVGIAPTTFVRLAQASGLASYKDLKIVFRRSLREAGRMAAK